MAECICKVCENSKNNRQFIAQEFQLGLMDEFEYFECSICGCVQIKEIPEDMDRYYPQDYYSFNAIKPSDSSFIKNILFRVSKFGMYCKINNNNFLANFIGNKIYPYHPWIAKGLIDYNSSILDVGCGDGNLLCKLNKFGFKDLTGVDPFISETINYNNGLVIYKKTIYELTDQYDFIMLHHSYEHMDNPIGVLKQIYQLLKPGASVLIRIPLAGSYSWRKYGRYWVQLDAPRHFFLHTVKSIAILAEKTNLTLNNIKFDSAYTQFTGSEKYLRNISNKSNEEIFTKTEIKNFKQLANYLNGINDGDSACFYLKKDK